ncbi:predicted protein [Sclerotinia sclerotiorum 1980 UF-70]|uniref:Uncharacterized protein n=1 Tax=Sclerotinia sclerotiorum (strain ATCC 18683 / 1980 / Ss-1) TaxID=665079 RepID=A7E6C5_SCLS1|nr:predicted protein [Sclerotinia sclerotiorum 1980 UF-70]EDN91447.1 predicted protein [Sclerotinia sclerotiorum 1980 UF-70]
MPPSVLTNKISRYMKAYVGRHQHHLERGMSPHEKLLGFVSMLALLINVQSP